MVVQLPVQGSLQLQLSRREHEVLPDCGGWLPARSGGGVLDLPDGHVDTGPLVLPALVNHQPPHIVLHATRLSSILKARLQGYRSWRVNWKLQVEGEGIFTKLAYQPFLL